MIGVVVLMQLSPVHGYQIGWALDSGLVRVAHISISGDGA